MKSLTYVIITLCMLNYVWTTDCIETKPSKSSDCTDYKLTEEEKQQSTPTVDACCYESVTMGGETEKECMSYVKSMAKGYASNLQKRKDAGQIEDYSFECGSDSDSGSGSGSNWLSLSLSFLLFGLLF